MKQVTIESCSDTTKRTENPEVPRYKDAHIIMTTTIFTIVCTLTAWKMYILYQHWFRGFRHMLMYFAFFD